MNEWFKAERHAERAHRYFEAGQWEKALDELQRALALNPNQSDWHYGAGQVLEEMGRHEEAIARYERVLQLRGQDVEVMVRMAMNLLHLQRPLRAIGVLERVNQIDPNYEPGYCQRIVAYAQIGDHDMAEQMFYLAQQINEQCPRCYDHIAQSLMIRGDLERAQWCWEQVVRLDPHGSDAHANLARIHWRRHHLGKAHNSFLQQLREQPGDVETLLDFALMLMESGKLSQAREKLQRVLELDPHIAEAHLRLGELASQMGHVESAQSELEMAQRLDPELPGVSLALAKLDHRRGSLQSARLHLQAELDQSGHSLAQQLDLARMLIELRLAEPAVTVLNALIGHPDLYDLSSQDMAAALLYRGVAMLLLGRRRQGIRDCREALSYDPRNAMAMHNLALAYLELHALARAAYWVRRAQPLRRGDPGLRHLKWRLFWARLGRLLSRGLRRR